MSPESRDDWRFREAVEAFAGAVAQRFVAPVDSQPEAQLTEPVGALLRACGEPWELAVDSYEQVKVQGVGWPDLGVTVNDLLCGYVELKAPGTGARHEQFTGRNREQWQRYKALPNLIYTDGAEWSLYRPGKRARHVRIAGDVSDGARSLDHAKLSELSELLRDFFHWKPSVPKTPEALAEFLAPLARFLRDEVRDALGRENAPLKQLASEWRGLLFAEADNAQFADAYAQTLTYALLLAHFEGAESLGRGRATEALEREHALLAEVLGLLEARSVRAELALPIDLLERTIGAVSIDALQADGGDLWLYFYEQFLAAYDPALRRNRGVYYTPAEVVRCQVDLAGQLLRERFGKRFAFAEDGVTVLDPATGTGAYPIAVLDHAAKAVSGHYGEGAVQDRLVDLADCLHGIELLVGPYSVAHLRVTQRLRDAGVTDRPARIYLADTLESPNRPSQFTASILQAQLTKERERARAVKRDTRVLVCLGNPPYDREEQDSNPDAPAQQRKGGWVRFGDEGSGEAPILEDFLKPVRDAGDGLHLKNLYNDYVYFWRWALWKVFDSTGDGGIVSFITPASYLQGPGFAGMRRKMREVFDDLWIIDLGGEGRGARKSENVFSIQTPVAIAVGVRGGKPDPGRPAGVWKARLTGTRQEKLAALDAAKTFAALVWHECTADWNAPFFPTDNSAYFDWPIITDVFPWQHSGSQLKRTWPIGETEAVLERRWRDLLSRPLPARREAFVQTRDRHIDRSYANLFSGEPDRPIAELETGEPCLPIKRYAYRSFDRQWIIAATSLADRSRPDLWRAHGSQQTYIIGFQNNVLGEGPAAVAAAEIPDMDHFRGSFGARHTIPLYRDAAATEPNVTGGLPERIGEAHGAPVSAERLFAYAYGILAQRACVERFWDELEQPPPRLPITKDADLFGRVADLGERLLHLHTYGERYTGSGRGTDVPHGEARCTQSVPPDHYPDGHAYDAENRVLRVGRDEHAGQFAPVAPEVWDYSVSGMRIVDAWLNRRKENRSGKKSSPLDDIRPERWTFGEELLELLWVLEGTLALEPEGATLLDEVCASPLFTAAELPQPSPAERKPPRPAPGEQADLL